MGNNTSGCVSKSTYSAISGRRARATKSLVVKSLNKDGSVSRMALTASDMQLNAFASRDAAETRRAELESMNPGRRFVVVSL